MRKVVVFVFVLGLAFSAMAQELPVADSAPVAVAPVKDRMVELKDAYSKLIENRKKLQSDLVQTEQAIIEVMSRISEREVMAKENTAIISGE